MTSREPKGKAVRSAILATAWLLSFLYKNYLVAFVSYLVVHRIAEKFRLDFYETWHANNNLVGSD